MSFQQALSGINAAARSLDLIGNNVANANTVGYKSATAVFSDVYASAGTQARSDTAQGRGVQVAAISRQFDQGQISGSANNLDMAINGNGFFILSNNGATSYSRNGQFQINPDNYVVNTAGNRLSGYLANPDGSITDTVIREIQLPAFDQVAEASTRLKMGVNLDAREPAIDSKFDPANAATFNHSTSTTVYDSQGTPRQLSLYYVKRAPNAWEMHARLEGSTAAITFDDQAEFATLAFGENGLLTGDGAPRLRIGLAAEQANLGTGVQDLDIRLDAGSSQQFASAFSAHAMTQDGYGPGSLSSYSVTAGGVIEANYTNGRKVSVAQVVLAAFANPQGLGTAGDNQWVATPGAGAVQTGVPGTGNLGGIEAASLEGSNVDLTAELISMITAQRFYQANAQGIKTEDQLLQTVINLR